MRVLNIVIFICALASITVPAWAVEITPSNVVYPTSSGEVFSFDYIISDVYPIGLTVMGFKSTINVSPGGLTLDVTSSVSVGNDLGYWIYNNNAGINVLDKGSNNYEFADNPDSPNTEQLFLGDIMARYAFTWDGVVDDYTFTLDLDTSNSYVALDYVTKEALLLNPGNYPGDSSSFTVTIPEPATLMLLALGSTILFRKRRA